MTINKNNYVIECDTYHSYLDETISFLEKDMARLMTFFNLDKLEKPGIIVIFDSLKSYIDHCSKYTKYKDWMCADTFDGNINMLSIEECKKTKSHSDMDLSQFKDNIVHEFVHICQRNAQKEKSNTDNSWFYECLATNLGNPDYFEIKPFKVTKEALYDFDNLDNNYEVTYTIGRFLLENYSHKKILDYVYHPDILDGDMNNIIKDAASWVKENTKHI